MESGQLQQIESTRRRCALQEEKKRLRAMMGATFDQIKQVQRLREGHIRTSSQDQKFNHKTIAEPDHENDGDYRKGDEWQHLAQEAIYLQMQSQSPSNLAVNGSRQFSISQMYRKNRLKKRLAQLQKDELSLELKLQKLELRAPQQKQQSLQEQLNLARKMKQFVRERKRANEAQLEDLYEQSKQRNKIRQRVNQCFQQFITKAIPLTLYLESVSAIAITKGLAKIQNPPPSIIVLYYAYLGTIYGFQMLRVLLMKFLKGYSRGFWIHTMTTAQFFIHLLIIIGFLSYEAEQPYSSWTEWEQVIFILAWGSTMSIRLAFIKLVSLQVFNRKRDWMKIKEIYWLAMTTKEELFLHWGRLCHDPHEAAEQQHQKSLVNTKHLRDQ